MMCRFDIWTPFPPADSTHMYCTTEQAWRLQHASSEWPPATQAQICLCGELQFTRPLRKTRMDYEEGELFTARMVHTVPTVLTVKVRHPAAASRLISPSILPFAAQRTRGPFQCQAATLASIDCVASNKSRLA